MKILTIEDLNQHGHDVYEFCYNCDHPNCWNKMSLYVDSDDMVYLQKYLNQVFDNFHYFGDQKVTIMEWEKVKTLCLEEDDSKNSFFDAIDTWKMKDPNNDKYFWILGI